MALITKTFDQIVTDQFAAIHNKSTVLIDSAIGSVLRSIVESNASIALWFQGQLLQLLATTRAATSSGTDLDSWGLDYSFTRLPGVASTGVATFSRFSSGSEALVQPDTKVQTSDTTPVIFTVLKDTGNPKWSASLNGYFAAKGVGSIDVPVQCTSLGVIGNIQAGQCNVLTGSIPGIDTVSNTVAIVNGVDAESDTAFRARFVSYLSGLAKATKSAVSAAISGVQQGLSFTITENLDYTTGTSRLGYFSVVVDDGSGAPSSTLIASINNAIDTVRAFTVNFEVHGPTLQTANVAMTITSTNKAADILLVQTAISAYIASLGIGVSLPYTKLSQLAYDASPTITNVTAVTLNSGTADITVDSKHRIIALFTAGTAGAFVIGTTYMIASVGTTNFMLIGASSNAIGVVFTATGAGTGTGTANTFAII